MKKIKLRQQLRNPSKHTPHLEVEMHQNHEAAQDRWKAISAKYSARYAGGEKQIVFQSSDAFWQFAKELEYGTSIRSVTVSVTSDKLSTQTISQIRNWNIKRFNDKKAYVLSASPNITNSMIFQIPDYPSSSKFFRYFSDLGLDHKDFQKDESSAYVIDEGTAMKLMLLGLQIQFHEIPAINPLTLQALNPPDDVNDSMFHIERVYWKGSSFSTIMIDTIVPR